jgi:uncharacterized protein involved in tellurium resistance
MVMMKATFELPKERIIALEMTETEARQLKDLVGSISNHSGILRVENSELYFDSEVLCNFFSILYDTLDDIGVMVGDER